MSAGGAVTRLVWDWPVRLTHWLLVVSCSGSYITHRLGPDQFRYHRWCGYATLLLVSVRLVWGFAGTRHARFASFLRSPRAVGRYLVGLRRDRQVHSVGHNPAGGWMVLVLLALLLAQALTGLFANDEIMNTGPLYGYVSDHTSDRLSGWHHILFDSLLVAIALHVIAIGAYRLVMKTNLVAPMLTGRKSADEVGPADEIPGSRIMLWLALLAAAGALLAWTIERAPEASLYVF